MRLNQNQLRKIQLQAVNWRRAFLTTLLDKLQQRYKIGDTENWKGANRTPRPMRGAPNEIKVTRYTLTKRTNWKYNEKYYKGYKLWQGQSRTRHVHVNHGMFLLVLVRYHIFIRYSIPWFIFDTRYSIDTSKAISTMQCRFTKSMNNSQTLPSLLRGESSLCHVFSVKSVQNLRTFWRTTQNLLILALLCGLYSKQTFKVHLGVEKHIER